MKFIAVLFKYLMLAGLVAAAITRGGWGFAGWLLVIATMMVIAHAKGCSPQGVRRVFFLAGASLIWYLSGQFLIALVAIPFLYLGYSIFDSRITVLSHKPWHPMSLEEAYWRGIVWLPGRPAFTGLQQSQQHDAEA